VTVAVNNNVVINKNLTVNAGPGNNTVTFGTATVTGDTQLNLGTGNDALTVNAGASPTFGAGSSGGLTLTTTGSGSDSVTLTGGTLVMGNLSLNLGDGANNLTGLNPATPFTVSGNMSVTAGNGNNVAYTLNASVGGSLTFNYGNGNDSVTVANAPGTTLSWTSGNGNDALTLGLATATANSSWNVNALFGSGANTFTLTDSTASGGHETITGTVNLGSNTADVFNHGASWTIGSPWSLTM
jgi:hypothetical protein